MSSRERLKLDMCWAQATTDIQAPGLKLSKQDVNLWLQAALGVFIELELVLNR